MILRHRDRELLRFEWTGVRGVLVLSVNEAERKFLPIDMAGVATDESLWKWILTRTVPRGRKYILAALRQLGIPSNDVRAIVEFSRGLSLNDILNRDEDVKKPISSRSSRTRRIPVGRTPSGSST